jgi:integrase
MHLFDELQVREVTLRNRIVVSPMCEYSSTSPYGTGRPRWPWTIKRTQLLPAGIRAGLGRIGWHTFRHSYSTLLRALRVDLKVQQELLRHAEHPHDNEHLHAGDA